MENGHEQKWPEANTVLRDFAGHPLYHSVHQIYMTGHCVYVIVFNIAEAKRNFKYAFADIP
jgi:GTPase SAR1 family protein